MPFVITVPVISRQVPWIGKAEAEASAGDVEGFRQAKTSRQTEMSRVHFIS
jgi:hypothetical protein